VRNQLPVQVTNENQGRRVLPAGARASITLHGPNTHRDVPSLVITPIAGTASVQTYWCRHLGARRFVNLEAKDSAAIFGVRAARTRFR